MEDTALGIESNDPRDFDPRLFLQLWSLLGLGLVLAWQMEKLGGGQIAAVAARLGVSLEQAREALRWTCGESLPAVLEAQIGLETMHGLAAGLLAGAPSLFRLALLPVLARHLVRLGLRQADQAGSMFRDLRALIGELVLARTAGARDVRERARKVLSRALSAAWCAQETQLGPEVVQHVSTTDLGRLAPRPDLEDISADLRAAAAAGEDDAALKRRLHKALDGAPTERVDTPVSEAGLVREVEKANRACRGHGLQVRLLRRAAEVPSLSAMAREIRPCTQYGSLPGRAKCPVDRRCGAGACRVAMGATAAWLAGLVSDSKALLPSLPAALAPLLLPGIHSATASRRRAAAV
ncbi:MAG: hypothetical protein ABIO70_12310 [Pseudomonadota bacterium]